MDKLNLEYYNGSEAEQFSFIRIPRLILTLPQYKNLSDGAKIIYGLMHDRMSLSVKNKWLDSDNRVYIYFTLEDVKENLNCGNTKGVKILAELDSHTGIGLIERKKQGQGKPTRIYVKNFNSIPHNPTNPEQNSDFGKMEVKTSADERSRLSENVSADFPKADTNHTNHNQNNFSNTENKSIYQSAAHNQRNASDSENSDIITNYKTIIHENIDYGSLVENYGAERIDEYVEIMLDAMCSGRKTIRVSGVECPAEVIKSRLLKLDYSHIEYVLDSMAKNTTKIHNIKNYLLTALYNSYSTIDSYYRAEVRHDLYGVP